MEHFWDTVDTIGEGFGFSLFGARHLVTLALYIGFAALSCKLYKEADEKKRETEYDADREAGETERGTGAMVVAATSFSCCCTKSCVCRFSSSKLIG